MKIPAAILSGVAVSVASALPLAWLGGGLSAGLGAISWGALILGVCAGICVWMTTPESPTFSPRTVWEWLMIAIFVCASARAVLWLIYEDGESWKILSPDNLGDLSLHLTFIHWLSATHHWWPSSPILSGDPLRYPLGSDLFNALLLVAGVPVVQGLIWCALVGAALTGYALWRWGRGIALAALLFNGGLNFLGVFFASGLNGVSLWFHGDPDAVMEWKNLFLSLFVTQRGFLFALPAGLLLLSAWRDENFGTERRIVLPLPVQALLLASLPLFSIHAALYLVVAMVGVALASGREGKIRLLKLAVVAGPFMAFFGWLVATGAGGPSAVHSLGWSPGWMSDGTLLFWFRNFGFVLPLAVLLVIVLFMRRGDSRNREARAFVWPAVFVFVCCLLIRFAPWPWDNMKLMLWSWIVIAPYLWSQLIKGRPLFLRALACILLFASGAITLVAGLDGRHGYELINRESLNQTEWLLKDIPVDQVIACAPDYNHPVLLLGHPVVCGYEGHLWSHGLDYKERLKRLNRVMAGESTWKEDARKLGASWIYWGDREKARWPDSKLPWATEKESALHRLTD